MLGAVLALAVSAPVSAAREASFVVTSRQAGPFPVAMASRLRQAVTAFGPPTSQALAPGVCTARWRPLGLTIAFVDSPDIGDPCRRGTLITITITSRPRWRTGRGLRIGDSTARLRALYPHLAIRANPPYWIDDGFGFWLARELPCPKAHRTGGDPLMIAELDPYLTHVTRIEELPAIPCRKPIFG